MACGSYASAKVEAWFQGGLDDGQWRCGFDATDNAEPAKAVTLHQRDLPIHQNHPSKPPELQRAIKKTASTTWAGRS